MSGDWKFWCSFSEPKANDWVPVDAESPGEAIRLFCRAMEKHDCFLHINGRGKVWCQSQLNGGRKNTSRWDVVATKVFKYKVEGES